MLIPTLLIDKKNGSCFLSLFIVIIIMVLAHFLSGWFRLPCREWPPSFAFTLQSSCPKTYILTSIGSFKNLKWSDSESVEWLILNLLIVLHYIMLMCVICYAMAPATLFAHKTPLGEYLIASESYLKYCILFRFQLSKISGIVWALSLR